MIGYLFDYSCEQEEETPEGMTRRREMDRRSGGGDEGVEPAESGGGWKLRCIILFALLFLDR